MALVLGGESAGHVFWLSSATKQLNSTSQSTPSKTTSVPRPPITSRQLKCSASPKQTTAIESTEMVTVDMTLTGIVSRITSLEMLTKDTIEKIRAFDKDRVRLHNLKVSGATSPT
jgi:hypothetical protein